MIRNSTAIGVFQLGGFGFNLGYQMIYGLKYVRWLKTGDGTGCFKLVKKRPVEIKMTLKVVGKIEMPYMNAKMAVPYMMEPVKSNFSSRAPVHSPLSLKRTSRIITTPKGILSKKILRQLIYWIISPPKNGPQDNPLYTAATAIPNTLPRSSGGYTDVNMAMLVAKHMALLAP